MIKSKFNFEKFGKYILVKKIATGGMAEIFLATSHLSKEISKFVVVKRILSQFSSNKNFKDMFKNEGRLTVNFRHANIISIHEFGVEKDLLYMTMDYVSGCSLKDLIVKTRKKKVRLSIPIIVHIVRSVASALHYAHNFIDPSTGQPLNIIHRDVSHHNIMLGFNGDVKLIDFGIAKGQDMNLTSAGVMKGKFSYMSPEQVKGQPLDARTDIYSLGVVLWELLAGRKLFTGSNINEIIEAIKEHNIPDIRTIRADIPNALVNILNLSLDKNREKRYQNAEKLERHLNSFLNHEYTSFSNYDFQLSIKSLYENQILKERQFLAESSKALKQMNTETEKTFASKSHNVLTKQPALNLDNDKKSSLSLKNSNENDTKSKSLTILKKEAPLAPVHYSGQNSIGETTIRAQFKMNTKDLEQISDSEEDKNCDEDIAQKTSFSSLADRVQSQQKAQKKVGVFVNLIILAGVMGGIYYSIFHADLAGIFTDVSSPIEDIEDGSLGGVEGLGSLPPQIKRNISDDVISKNSEDQRNLTSTFRIFIETKPSGSHIYVNETKISKTTPSSVMLGRGKEHVIKIKKPGYQSVTIRNINKPRHISLSLNKK